MIDRDQQVEEKLESLRPTKPSAELIDRIAQRAMERQPIAELNKQDSRGQPFLIWSVFAGLAAVLLVALAMRFLVPSDESRVAEPKGGAEGGPEVVPSENDNDEPPKLFDLARQEMDEDLPTLGNYLSAMRESPELFDTLLQKHAANLLPPTGNPTLDELTKENPL